MSERNLPFLELKRQQHTPPCHRLTAWEEVVAVQLRKCQVCVTHKLFDEMPQLICFFEPSHHVMSVVEAYVDSYGPAVNYLTSLWT
jgi:hypothetical protein